MNNQELMEPWGFSRRYVKQERHQTAPLEERILALKEELANVKPPYGNATRQKERIQIRIRLAEEELAVRMTAGLGLGYRGYHSPEERLAEERSALEIMASSGLKPLNKPGSLWGKYLAKLGIRSAKK